jgi:hypothetical protein
MKTSWKLALAVPLTVASVAVPNVGCAQVDLPSAAVAIAEYGRNTADPEADYPSDRYPAARWVNATLIQPGRYTAARVDSILDGLQELAAHASSARTRLQATIELTNAGNKASARGLVVVRRVTAVYSAAVQSDDEAVQRIILRMMPVQEEESEALSFLESVARTGSTEQARRAFASLEAMGPNGDELLRRLDETNSVGDPVARAGLHSARTAPR